MAKREFISREEALSHPFANGKYDHKNADINFILGHESYKEWLETFTVFTEQEIVKPYLEKLKADIENEIRFWQEPNKYDNVVKRVREAKVFSYKHMLELIDNLLSEQEVQEDGK